jgi:hypothetical protein
MASPDLMAAQGSAGRQRQIADMLMQGVQRQDNTSLAGGLSQLGQAFLARGANKKADAAEDKAQSVQSLLVQNAMKGDQASIAQLLAGDPAAAINYKMQGDATAKADARYADETGYIRGRNATLDAMGAEQHTADMAARQREAQGYRWATPEELQAAGLRGGSAQVGPDKRLVVVKEPPAPVTRAPYSFHTLGEGAGAVFNPQTGDYEIVGSRGGAPAGSGPGGVDPRQTDNDFFRSQGIEAQLTQFATGDGGVGINQQGVYDDTRPDDASGPNSGSYDTYRARTRGAGDTKRIGTIREQTSTAVNDLDMLLNEAQTLIEEGVPSGVFAKTRTELGKLNSGLKSATGLDLSGLPFVPDETETAQMGAMQSIQTQLALLRTQLTKGAISNYEMEMFVQSVPGLSNTPEGNALILENMRKMQARTIAYGEAADTWDQMFGGVSAANPKTGQSFDQAWAEYTKNNPWLELRGAPVSAAPTSGSTGTGARGGVRSGAAGGRGGSAPVTINDDAGYDALPSGAEFIGPDGVRRRKP